MLYSELILGLQAEKKGSWEDTIAINEAKTKSILPFLAPEDTP